MFSSGKFSNHINRHRITYAWLVILLLVFSATISLTLAFFYHEDWANNSIGTSGAVTITAVGDNNASIQDNGKTCRLVVTLDDYYENLVIPNAPLSLTANCKVSNSTTNPLLRASFKLEFIDKTLGVPVKNNSTIDGFVANMQGELATIVTANGWFLQDGYYYYVGTDAITSAGNTILKEVEFEGSSDTIVPFINQSVHVPSSITSEYSGYKLKFTIIFQAIQNYIPNDAGEKMPNTITNSLKIFNDFANWDENKEEFVWEYTEDGNGIYFGYWPQTIKADNVTITSTTPDADGFYEGSDGERYAKLVTTYDGLVSLDFLEFFYYINGNVASDGTVMNKDETYYFKVEKLRWTILSQDGTTNRATILCDSIIQGQQYQPYYTYQNSYYYATDSSGNILLDDDGNQVYANNYKYSALRNFLTTTFYESAFTSMQKAIIQQIEVDNSASSTASDENPYACENTSDKVWAMSFEELYNMIDTSSDNPLVGHENLFLKPTTDFARATCSITNNELASSRNVYQVLEMWNCLTGKESEDITYEECTDVQKELITKVYNSGAWWLRSPTPGYSVRACIVGYYGYTNPYVDAPSYGAVPALQIQL